MKILVLFFTRTKHRWPCLVRFTGSYGICSWSTYLFWCRGERLSEADIQAMSVKSGNPTEGPPSRGVTRFDDARARSKFGAPMFEPEIFRKQIYCIEKSTCDIVGTFRRHPQSFGAHGSDSVPP